MALLERTLATLGDPSTTSFARLYCTIDDADLDPTWVDPYPSDPNPIGGARVVSATCVNGYPHTLDVYFIDPRNGKTSDARTLDTRIGSPGTVTYTLPTQASKRVNFADLSVGFGGTPQQMQR